MSYHEMLKKQATIKQWAKTFYVLGKALSQTIITEWNNPDSPFKERYMSTLEFVADRSIIITDKKRRSISTSVAHKAK